MLKLLAIFFVLVSLSVAIHGLGSIEAVMGILMFGWSTGVLFSVVNHLLGRFKNGSGASNPGVP